MTGFTIKCNNCGAEATYTDNITGEHTFSGDVNITSYPTGYGGETGVALICTKCEKRIKCEEIL